MDNIDRLIECGRLLHEHGLVIGSGGNISIMGAEGVIIKKSGVDMSRAGRGDYIKLPVTEGDLPRDPYLSSETPLHIACYSSREGIGSVVHAHSPYTISAAARIDVLESPSYEFDCAIGAPVPVIPYVKPGSEELGRAVAEKLASGANAVLLRRHGSVAVGKTIDEAFLRALALERACIAFLFS